MKKLLLTVAFCAAMVCACAQDRAKVYDESINPDTQITEAVDKAASEGKNVIAQLGGNWCKWCIRFARFVEDDPEIKKLVDDNFEFIHVNYNPRNADEGSNKEATEAALRHLGNPVKLGFPVLIVLDTKGNILHTQETGSLESGESYDKTKVMEFFKAWAPDSPSMNAKAEGADSGILKADVQAEYPGGMEKLMKFLGSNIKYPKAASKEKREGKSVVRFTVNTDGALSDLKIIESSYPDFDEEALRVVKKMPNWIPAQKDGKPVASEFTMPVTFRLP